jgi:hypothetical protein
MEETINYQTRHPDTYGPKHPNLVNAPGQQQSVSTTTTQPNRQPPARPAQLREMTANDITQAVINFINVNDGYAVRINCYGIYDATKGQWRKSKTPAGTADIHASIKGRHLSIEIKAGRDQQSEVQKQTQHKVERSGGFYLLIRSFEEFHRWYNQFTIRVN